MECYYLECVTPANNQENGDLSAPRLVPSFLLPRSGVLGAFSLLHWRVNHNESMRYALSSALNTRLLPVHPEPDDVSRDSKKNYLRARADRWKIPSRIYEVSRNYQTSLQYYIQRNKSRKSTVFDGHCRILLNNKNKIF